MSWSWSHTADAYQDACLNVHNKDRHWLEVVYAEWEACKAPSVDSVQFDQFRYKVALRRAQKLATDVLADYIWDRMTNYAVCTNGGHNAYGCPSGCHLVSFDHEETEQEAKDRKFGEEADLEWEIACQEAEYAEEDE